MAVGYTSDTDQTPATSSSIVYTSFAVSGTNPVILLLIGLNSATATVSSVVLSAGLSGGTPVEFTLRNDTTYLSLWCIPAPTGTGTITATLSASVDWQSNAILMSGADQTTPCPSGAGNTGTATGEATNPLVITLGNLTANDAAVGFGANTLAGDHPDWMNNGDAASGDTFFNNSTNVNMAGGYRLGTGDVSMNWVATSGTDSFLAVRVVAAAGGAGPTTAQTMPAMFMENVHSTMIGRRLI